MIDDIRKRFADFDKNGFFVKADTENWADWNIGLDNNGFPSLKLRGEFEPQKVDETTLIGVTQFQKESQRSIVFSLLDNRYKEQFYYFCSDLISSTKGLENDEDCYRVAISNYWKWRKMFKTVVSDFLSEKEMMGLMAELCFLKDYMIPSYGDGNAVKSWTGQELTKKDFSIDDIWFEVKAVSKGKGSVRITSLEQLDGNEKGSLVVYVMEKMSAVSGTVSLNGLVKGVYDSLTSEDIKELFMEKVSLQGFVFHEYYDDHRYAIDPCRKFAIKDGFPRLIPGCVPEAVIKAEYEIDFNGLLGFEL